MSSKPLLRLINLIKLCHTANKQNILDFMKILRHFLPINPYTVVNIAKMVIKRDQGPPKANIDQFFNAFFELNKLQECTAFLLETLKETA